MGVDAFMDRKLLNTIQIIAAIAAAVVVAYSWFYMPVQFSWAITFVNIAILLIVLLEYLKIKLWFKEAVSIQVIVHKNEKGEVQVKK